MTRVRLGFFEDFKSSDTLLLEADCEGLQALAVVFRSLAAGTHEVLALHELSLFEVHHGVQLTARRTSRDHGTRRLNAGTAFLWERTSDGWVDAAEKLEVLTRYEGAHHTLDAEDDEVVVQVSKGEYGDGWWLTHS